MLKAAAASVSEIPASWRAVEHTHTNTDGHRQMHCADDVQRTVSKSAIAAAAEDADDQRGKSCLKVNTAAAAENGRENVDWLVGI